MLRRYNRTEYENTLRDLLGVPADVKELLPEDSLAYGFDNIGEALNLPNRTFIFVGDGGYGTHEVARFCNRHRDRLSSVSKFHPDANLFDPPPTYRGRGRPPVKGRRRREPCQAVAGTATKNRKPLTVDWYGGGTRTVGVVTQSAHWFKSGHGLLPVRWVLAEDRTGTHRQEYLFTTDASLSASVIIGLYCGRWNIETTFQELRGSGLESMRGWC